MICHTVLKVTKQLREGQVQNAQSQTNPLFYYVPLKFSGATFADYSQNLK